MPTATCACGACHIVLDKFLGTAMCHCLTCRKYTSANYSLSAVTTADAFHLVKGSPKPHKQFGDTGVPSTRYFCGECGSTLWIEHSPKPELRIIKAGVVDGDGALDDLKPLFEQYVKRRPQWLPAVEGAAQFDEMRTVEYRDQHLAKALEANGRKV